VLVVDTGVLVAAADRTDRNHQRCVAVLEAASTPLVTTGLVIAESAYLIERELGTDAEQLLYESIIDQALRVEDLTLADWQRIADLVGQYGDLPLGGTDASVIAIAERLDQSTIATLDRRHFSVVRPAHTDAFELIP
jgi:predicted nucleic acid-binding protein